MITLGIDLGNNYIRACYSDGEEVHEVVAREGPTIQGRLLPSYVEFNQDGTPLYVGKQAYDDYLIGIDNPIVWGIRRLIGLSLEEAKRELRYLDFQIERNDDGGIIIPVGQQTYTPVDIAAMIMNKIKKDALDVSLNTVTKIDRVVVSHPAYFDGSRREATLRATRQAFSELSEDAIDLVPEPTAAALGYGLRLSNRPELVCIVQMGDKTLDVTTAVAGCDESGRVRIMGDPTLGIVACGGIDIDEILLDWAIQEYKLTDLQEIRAQGMTDNMDSARVYYELRELRAGLETLKIRLSNFKRVPQQQIEVMHHGEVLEISLTRDKLEEILDTPLPLEKVFEFIKPRMFTDDLRNLSGFSRKEMFEAEDSFNFSLDGEELAKAEEFFNVRLNGTIISGGDQFLREQVLNLMFELQQVLFKFHPDEKRQRPSVLDILRLAIMVSLTRGGYTTGDVDHVLLVGRSMYIPCVRKTIRDVVATNERVRRELEQIEKEGFPVDPVRCIAQGAALYGEAGLPIPPSSL